MKIKFTANKWIAFLATIILSSLLISLSSAIYADSFRDFIDIAYGTVDFENYETLFLSFFKWIFPQMIILLFLGNYLEVNFMDRAEMIFTRTRHIQKQVMPLSLELFLVTLIACTLFGIVGFCVYTGTYGIDRIPYVVFTNMLIYFVYTFMIVLTTNLLSISMKASYAFMIIIGIQIFSFAIDQLIYDQWLSHKLYYIVPSSNVLFALKENDHSLFSILYLMFIVFVVYGLTVWRLKHKEVL